ncbi:hypothetical protein CFC21_108949 [Triticum aestivum]|uniref:Uncharacterized protein n=2 Tax=Triticum aestivum TaxID=4565 RepID=A0A3B6TIK9_WHEAT|nr:uncharacterized protein LOC123163633 [Triticum aestivum]KAF7108487.1 hypothetical protein CFC21_108949 [Triticum aestivum]
MALRSPSSTRRQDWPPADSPPPTYQSYQGGSSNGAESDFARKTKQEVNHLLAKLEKKGVEIDGKVASIIGDGITRIKVEAAWEDFDESNTKLMAALLTAASMAVGFIMGLDWRENCFRKQFDKRRHT